MIDYYNTKLFIVIVQFVLLILYIYSIGNVNMTVLKSKLKNIAVCFAIMLLSWVFMDIYFYSSPLVEINTLEYEILYIHDKNGRLVYDENGPTENEKNMLNIGETYDIFYIIGHSHSNYRIEEFTPNEIVVLSDDLIFVVEEKIRIKHRLYTHEKIEYIKY